MAQVDPYAASAESNDPYAATSEKSDAPPPTQTAPKEPSYYDKLTAPIDPGAEKYGPVGRTLSSMGGTILGSPGAVYHAFADAPTEEEKTRYAKFEQEHGEAPGTQTSGVHRAALGVQRLAVDP